MAGPKSRRSSGASTPAKASSERILESAAMDSPTVFSTPTKEATEVVADVQAVNCSVYGVDERDMFLSARIWMSEEAMVATGIATGSFVSVSVRESESTASPATLTDRCGAYFNIDVSSLTKGKSFGAYYAVAEVWPSRKLSRYGIRISKYLATSLGHPEVGSSLFLNPIILGRKEHSRNNSSTYATMAEVVDCTDLSLQWCPPLQNHITSSTLPPPSSPLFKTPSSSSKRMSRISSPCQEQAKDQFRHSPSPSPAGKMDTRRLEGSPRVMIQEEAKLSTQNLGNIAAVQSFFEDESGKETASESGKGYVQLIASKWLNGHYLLLGSLLQLRLCGCDCIFVVTQVRMPLDEKDMGELHVTGVLPPPPLSIYKVGHKTKIKLYGQPHVDLGIQPQAQQVEGLCTNATGESTGKVVEAIKYTALGGLEGQIEEIKQIVHFSLIRPDLLAGYGLRPHQGILLYGPPGTGKSTLARAAACEAGVPLFAIDGPDVVSQFYGESEEAMRAVFTAAEEAAPAVIVIDEVDAIAPERKDGSEELAQRMVGTLLKLMDEGGDKHVLVIAATNRPDALDPALRRPGRFDKEIEIGVPTSRGRHQILGHFLSKLKHALADGEILELSTGTHGFVGADLSSLCHEAALAALRRYIQWKNNFSSPSCSPTFSPAARLLSDVVLSRGSDNRNNEGAVSLELKEAKMRPSDSNGEADTCITTMELLCTSLEGVQIDHQVPQGFLDLGESELCSLKITLEDFEVAKTRVRPSAMREVMLEVPKVRWVDIGGLEDVKQQLQEAVIWPQQHGNRLASMGAEPIRGVLLYGPPGCSKTLLARACASEAGLNFIAVKGPELFSKWVGESEKAVQALFARARIAAPSIVFFDEIDGLAVARSSGHADGLSVGDRVMSQLLTEMDGLKPSTGVSVIAATNRPDIIDSALLRPGRFDRQLYVGPPNEVAREKIFKIQLRNTPCSPLVDCATLAARTPSYTGADISAVCREAALAALEEDLNAAQVEVHHFELALAGVAPRNPGPNLELFAKFNRGSFP